MSRPGGLKLSTTQIVASLLATLTGAILASYLGVAGTLVGAAVGSVASTTGTEIYRYSLRRSQQQLKAAGEVLRSRHAGQHTGQTAAHTQGQAGPGDAATETLAAAGPVARGTGTARYGGRGRDTSPDATETQVIQAATSRWESRAGTGPAQHTAGQHASGALHGAAGPDGAGGDGEGDGSGPWWRGMSRRQWLAFGGVALGLFLGVLAVITIIELSVGKPLDAAVWGRHSTGTSVGSVLGGGHRSQPATPHSTGTPATPSSGATAPSSSPTATPSATAPSPTSSVSATPSSAPSATPTPSGGGQGSARDVTPTP
jgi:hypothetical protein